MLRNFASAPKGANPYAGVIRDPAGNFYGTTLYGGLANAGTVYKLDASGNETVLYSFTGGADGGSPYAGVIRDLAGNLYGTTYQGGTAGFGVVFMLDTACHQTVLYSFTGGADGGNPYAGVIRDSAGNLYGTTSGGGTGAGVVYKVNTAGVETVLYAFTGGSDGSYPYAGVICDAAGNLYGTTGFGGTAGRGVVYKVDTAGQETVLYSFTGGTDGDEPYAGVIRDAAGNLYGTTVYGGTGSYGVVYKLDPTNHETVLCNFTDGANGGSLYAGVIRDSTGNLYGTTGEGGAAYHGVVYKLDASGNEAVLYSFAGAGDGAGTEAGVIRDAAGNLYGTTFGGGTSGMGVVYKVDSASQETVLYSFPGAVEGSYPNSVIRDSAGNLYGTTGSGGTAGAGIVFKMDTAGRESVLYNFTGGADGGNPSGGLILDSAGNLYGTTQRGGDLGCIYVGGCGVVYEVNQAGQETVLYSFTDLAPDGAFPNGGLARDSSGNLYGTTAGGGYGDWGTVYKLDTAGHETVLYDFNGYNFDGAIPYAGVILDSSGNLYGTTEGGGLWGWGVVYKIASAGGYSVLYSFTGGADGSEPFAGVILDSAGNLYGTTYRGGGGNCYSGCGVVYKLDPAGNETVLYTFTGGADGGGPSGVILDSAGNLYGTTDSGGASNLGVVYKLDTTGNLIVLYSFAGADGAHPIGVIGGGECNLYGSTSSGGSHSAGVIFELKPQPAQ